MFKKEKLILYYSVRSFRELANITIKGLMMRKFATVRQSKTRTSEQFNAIKKHNERLMKSKNVNPSKSHLNVYFQKRIYPTLELFADAKRTQIRNSNKKNGTKNRMIRKEYNEETGKKEYKTMSQEFVFSFSRNALDRNQSIEYFRRIDAFMRRWFPNIEVLSSIIHFDEMTPHLHYEVSYFDQVECKFKQDILKDLGLTNINIIREAIQEIADDYGLERQDGSVVGERKHEAKASLEAMEERERVEAIEQENKDLFNEKNQIITQANEINGEVIEQNNLLKAILGSDVWKYSLKEFKTISEKVNFTAEKFLSNLERLGIKVEVEGLNDVPTLARSRNAEERAKNNSSGGAKQTLSPSSS